VVAPSVPARRAGRETGGGGDSARLCGSPGGPHTRVDQAWRRGLTHSDKEPDPGKRAALWLKRARLDFRHAQALVQTKRNKRTDVFVSDPALAIFLIQQCVEKLVKAMLAARGYSHQELITFSHKSLKAYLEHLQEVTDEMEPWLDIYPNDARALVRDSIDALKRARDDCDDPSYEHRWRACSYGDIVEVCRRLVEAREVITSEVTVELVKEAFDRIDTEALVGLMQAGGLDGTQELRLARREGSKLRAHVKEGLYSVWSYMALAPLAAITYPHAVSARYPSGPGAPTDPIEAAFQGKLGSDLYRAPLGIVEGLGEVLRLAELVLEGAPLSVHRTAAFSELTGEHKDQLREIVNSALSLPPPTS